MRIDFYSWRKMNCIWISKRNGNPDPAYQSWIFPIESPLRKGCLGKRIHSKRIRDSILPLCDETKVK